jgi:hypothetical protein
LKTLFYKLKFFFGVIGVAILLLNLYGLTQSLRPQNIDANQLRFGNVDVTLSAQEYKSGILRGPIESDYEYANRLTTVIAAGTAHIHWEDYDPALFNQLIPAWENWILYLMGHVSGIPEFQRYHFVNIEKSIERGIGICGDVSMLMTQLLERNNIEASLITFPGHVLVSAQIDGRDRLFDPDFGVSLPYSAEEVGRNLSSATEFYTRAGYTANDKQFFLNSFSKPFRKWDGPKEFITNKYYFEKASYWAIWIIPFILIMFSLKRRKS